MAQSGEPVSLAAKPFEGIAVQTAVGYQPFTINANNIRINPVNLKMPDQTYTGSSTPYFAGLSYTVVAKDRVTIGAQIEINPINQQYVVSLLPGYAISPSSQVYVKLAWVNALVTVDQSNGQSKFGANVNGATVGLGFKQLWTQNWYGFLEANYVKMNTFNFNTSVQGLTVSGSADYSGYNVMLGVGYKF